MNQKTLDKLKKNPHYKMNPNQRVEFSELHRKEMTQFGTIEKHSQNIPLNDVNQDKVEVTNKKRRIYGTEEK